VAEVRNFVDGGILAILGAVEGWVVSPIYSLVSWFWLREFFEDL